jgi:glycosyltransferase involved in cell wall biosynthesis
MFSSEYSIKNIIKFWINLPERVFYLIRFIKKNNIDLVYTNSITCLDGAIAAKFCRIPHIWHIHEILTNNSSIVSYMPQSIISFIINMLSKIIIVPSEAAKKQFKQSKNINRKIKVINNGVDVYKFIRGTGNEELPLAKGLDLENKYKVALIGTIQEIKGHFDLVEASVIVDKFYKNIIYLIAGGGNKKMLEKLKKRISEAGMSDKFIFLGFIERIDILIEKIDLLVCPSWVEAFSLTLLEAAAAGKPLIATRCGGPEEIILDGETGFLVKIKSPGSLANAIIKVISNPKLAQSMGKSGQNRVSELFTLERYVSDIEKIIDFV